jgi:cell division protein FtsB
MENRCSFCEKTFTSKSNLKAHINGAKYCISTRPTTTVVRVIFKCEGCDSELSSKQILDNHKSKCIDFILKKTREEHSKQIASLEKIISEKNIHIKELEDKLENIALKAVSYNYIDEDPRIIEIYRDEKEEDEEEKNEDTIQGMDIKQSLEPLNLGDDYTIEYREEDGYINVSNLCKAGGKQFNGWNRLEKTKGFLKALSSSTQIHVDELIKYKSGSNSERATWVHPQVAINIAQWVSPSFDVKVSSWVYEIMLTGKVDIKNTKSYKQLQQENKNQQLRIKVLENKYVKKQKRVDYKAENVIYILSTESSKKNNIYILGKAGNLTNRLSIYNKSEEHEVVFYKECSTPEVMSSVEGIIFQKLENYRQQANRERFILPEGKNISFFTNVIEKCIQFLEDK